ncbi:transcriptional regulator [Chryseobacterium sp. Leaf404]|uniref:BlaI/MecI/CopY family transcriptional regulator n=1 Tax=unclassified Chryseobacterium TaxID=2593645 RepID=UPI0006F2A10A|nr:MULTISPECIES: BlaI/MecI/CopY family transcriptional regulator [unclassified Chryseobacterium]KQT17958.1 transcriptional regulator [Chryseobacterium sp. Leaf404]
MKINHLTSAEENLMRLFWKLHSFYLKDVMEQHSDPKPHQNTVSTYLKILVEKGYLKTEKEGRIFRYSVLVPVEDYRNFLLKEISENFFDNSGKEIIAFLLRENLVVKEDLNEYFDHDLDLKAPKMKAPRLEIADEILNPKKDKKAKDKKKKKKKD